MFFGAAAVAIVAAVGIGGRALHASPTYAVAVIDVPDSGATAVHGVDVLGRVVGSYVDDRGTHGFLYVDGVLSTIDYPGAACGINNRGQIVGDYLAADGLRRGFLLSGGVYSTVAAPGNTGGGAWSINDAGDIAGYSGSVADGRGFVLEVGNLRQRPVATGPRERLWCRATNSGADGL